MKNNQRVADSNGPLKLGNNVIRDAQTAFRFFSKGQVDEDYIAALVDAGVVDQDFVDDVRNVDFTRPILSKARCDLLSFTPKLTGADITADKIKKGFLTNLKSASTPDAVKLRTNLQTANDGDAHQKETDAFMTACSNRPSRDFLADVLRILSHQRRAVRAHRGAEGAGKGQGIIEFDQTLPVDDLTDTKQALSPTDCTLK